MPIARLLPVVVASLVIAPDLVDGQELKPYLGETVRVVDQTGVGGANGIEGRLVGYDLRGIGVGVSDDSVVWIPRERLVSVSMGQTLTSTRNRQLVGAIVGVGLGGGVGSLIQYQDDCASLDWVVIIPVCKKGTSDRGLEGSLIGLGVGWLVGRSIKSERNTVSWTVVWQKTAPVGSRAGGTAMGLVVRLRSH